MHILYLDWPCFGKKDVLFTLEHTFHCRITKFFHEEYHMRESRPFDEAFDGLFEGEEYDACFSFNFFPLVAEGCHRHHLKYISLVYDNPQVKLYSYRVTYDTNYIFLFDSVLCEKFRQGGICTMYYHPLPVNGKAIDRLLKEPYDMKRAACEVSFIGSLYNEDHNLYDRMEKKLDAYSRGYLRGIMESQMQIAGYNFVEELLGAELVERMHQAEPYESNVDGVERLESIFADYYVNRKLTSIERIRLLSDVAGSYPLKLFTLNKNPGIPGAQNMGIADYHTEMPYVFHDSKINLNITLRSIQSGIPLRIMDILGAGGFLLTNFQADMLRHFVPGEDFVYYESREDLLDKIGYYLSHDKEREEIAANGHRKVLQNHSYEQCFREMFQVADLL